MTVQDLTNISANMTASLERVIRNKIEKGVRI